MVKLAYKMHKYDAMLGHYKAMLGYIDSAVTRNASEKKINSLLDFMQSATDLDLLQVRHTLHMAHCLGTHCTPTAIISAHIATLHIGHALHTCRSVRCTNRRDVTARAMLRSRCCCCRCLGHQTGAAEQAGDGVCQKRSDHC